MLLLGQTEVIGTTLDIDAKLLSLSVSKEPETVLEHVVHSDKRRQRALREAKREMLSSCISEQPLNVAAVLSQALESTHPLAIVRTVRKLQHEYLERKLAEVKEIASRRSGARGAKARKELIAAEGKVAESGLL